MKCINRIEWVAGLFEGEGCLTYIKKEDKWQMKVKMTDEDVIWDFYLAMNCKGNMYGLRKSPSTPDTSKPFAVWQTGKRDLIFELVVQMFPYMGNRRRVKMQEFMNWYMEKQK